MPFDFPRCSPARHFSALAVNARKAFRDGLIGIHFYG
jgi:LDH2 family malate/lactate/ureidoglycolate dehydrogenase